MLRVLIFLMLVANAVFFGWSQGWLDGIVGVRSIGDREPERLQKQVRPELIRILPPDAPASAGSGANGSTDSSTGTGTGNDAAGISGAAVEAAPPASTGPVSCLEAGPFAEAQIAAAQAAAQGTLPAGSWVTVKSAQPGEWVVYMGRFATREAQLRKADELKRRRLRFEEVRSPAALAPGLALGRFDQRRAAEQALDRFAQQGVRTARVLELAPAAMRNHLRVEKADTALAGQLVALKAVALGKGFAPCAVAVGT